MIQRIGNCQAERNEYLHKWQEFFSVIPCARHRPWPKVKNLQDQWKILRNRSTQNLGRQTRGERYGLRKIFTIFLGTRETVGNRSSTCLEHSTGAQPCHFSRCWIKSRTPCLYPLCLTGLSPLFLVMEGAMRRSTNLRTLTAVNRCVYDLSSTKELITLLWHMLKFH